MKLGQKFTVFIMGLGLLATAACSTAPTREIDAINRAAATGSPFTQSLTVEYRDYTNTEYYQEKDFPDGLHFARKGSTAATGEVVLPEPVEDWDLSLANVQEMGPARSQLIQALDAGGREMVPQLAARTQALFDCWVEEQEEDWGKDVPCRSQFYASLKELQAAVGAGKPAAPPPQQPVMAPIAEPAPAMEEPAQLPKEQATFLVFFDWDKSNVSAGAGDVLDAVVKEVKSRGDLNAVVVTGHADTSGPKTYNQKLSIRRAESVRDGLVQRGLPKGLIRVNGKGETQLLVDTPDGVREPGNRRAEINLE